MPLSKSIGASPENTYIWKHYSHHLFPHMNLSRILWNVSHSSKVSFLFPAALITKRASFMCIMSSSTKQKYASFYHSYLEPRSEITNEQTYSYQLLSAKEASKGYLHPENMFIPWTVLHCQRILINMYIWICCQHFSDIALSTVIGNAAALSINQETEYQTIFTVYSSKGPQI